jgi:hypothetical protein
LEVIRARASSNFLSFRVKKALIPLSASDSLPPDF